MSDVLHTLSRVFELEPAEAEALLDLVADADQRWLQARHGYARDTTVLPTMARRLADPTWVAVFSTVLRDDDELPEALRDRVLHVLAG